MAGVRFATLQHWLRPLALDVVDAEQHGDRGPGVRPETVTDLLVQVVGGGPGGKRCPIPGRRCRARSPRTLSSATGTKATRLRSAQRSASGSKCTQTFTITMRQSISRMERRCLG